MNIQTVQFPHILETRDLTALNDFLSHTAFVISHKSESIETLLRVLWYIPVNSTIIIVTNCQSSMHEELASTLKTRLENHQHTYLIHQKDARLARLLADAGVRQILGKDGRVRNGKGEGMYLGALAAQQLGYLRWLIFYDADNFVPSALLEYTFAMCRLFTAAPPIAAAYDADAHLRPMRQLQNVRICWSSKPDMKNLNLDARVLGRTSKVVSPVFDHLLTAWFGPQEHPIFSSNAGEQGMTLAAATALRFSSGFSVETFQLIDLLFQGVSAEDNAEEVIFQQYLSKSPHFHEKKGERHIKKMIEESLGCFFHFEDVLPASVKTYLQQLYTDLQLERAEPLVYPPLRTLDLIQSDFFMEAYALFPGKAYPIPTLLDLAPVDLLAPDLSYRQFRVGDIANPNMILAETLPHGRLLQEVMVQEVLAQEVIVQDSPGTGLLTNDVLLAD